MLNAIRYALELFSQFPKETGHDTGLRQTGSLMIALTPERMEAYARQIERSHRNGIEAGFVSHAEMVRLAPALDVTKVEGGYFVPNDGYVDPPAVRPRLCRRRKGSGSSNPTEYTRDRLPSAQCGNPRS